MTKKDFVDFCGTKYPSSVVAKSTKGSINGQRISMSHSEEYGDRISFHRFLNELFLRSLS